MVFIVDYSILSGRDALYLIVRFDAVHIPNATDIAVRELRRVADLEGDFLRIVKLTPRVFGDKVESLHVHDLAVLRLRVVSVRYIYYIAPDIFLDDEPRASAQA